MSYRNPQQVVDTQSAQHIANLQNVISGTIQKVGASYKADEDKRVAEERATAKERAKRINGYIETEQNVWTSAEKITKNNASLVYEGLDASIDDYSDISDKIDSGVLYGKELSDARAYQRDILSIPDRIKNVTTLYTEGTVGYDKAIRNAGNQGGVDMWSKSAVDNLAVWQDKAPGVRKIVINKNKDSGRIEVNLSITPEGGKERIYTESQLQQMSKDGGPMPLIPDETKDFEDAKAKYFYEIDNTTKKSVHREGILGEEESREIKNDKGVVTAIQYYRPVNKEKAKLASRAMAKLNVESMTPFNGAMFANNILGFGGTKDQVTENNFKEKWPEIIDAYNDYLVNNYTDELKVRTEKVETPSAPTEGQIRRGIAASQAKIDLVDIMEQPEDYFKNKKVGGKDIIGVKVENIPAASSGTGKGASAKASKILELTFVARKADKDGEQLTDTMKFDLNNPTRLKTLIDLLPDNDTLKKELKKLINPLLKK